MGIAAGISALGSFGSGLFSSNAAGQAGQAQAAATKQAIDYNSAIFHEAEGNFAPYLSTGTSANSLLNSQLPSLSQGFSPTQSQIEQTPGYQFDLMQGLKSTQNGAAARGLGVSGAALKGASKYATGLADNTLQTQFNIDQTNKTNSYNKLLGTSTLGADSAYKLGAVGTGTGNTVASSALQGGQAQASADIAQGTAFNPLLGNLGNFYAVGNYQNNGLANRVNGSANQGNYYTTTNFGSSGKGLF